MRKLFIVLLALMTISCNVQKKAMKQRIDHLEQVTKGKSDSIRVLSLEITKLEQELRENSYGEITFDTSAWVPANSYKGLRDSLLKWKSHGVIKLDTSWNTPKPTDNKVRMLPDGTVEASGAISKFKFEKQLFIRQLAEIKRSNDSLHAGWEAEKKNIKTVETVEWKDRKVTVFPWYFWLLLFVAFAFGWKFTKFFDHIRTKLKLDPNQVGKS